MTGDELAIHSIQFSPSGKLIAAGGSDGKVRIWMHGEPTSEASISEPTCLSSDSRSRFCFALVQTWNLPFAFEYTFIRKSNSPHRLHRHHDLHPGAHRVQYRLFQGPAHGVHP